MIELNGARSMAAAGRPGTAIVLALGLAVGLLAVPSRAEAQGCFDVDSVNSDCSCGGLFGSGDDDRPSPDPPQQSSLPPVDLFGARQCPSAEPWSLAVTVTWCGDRPDGCGVTMGSPCGVGGEEPLEGIYYAIHGVWQLPPATLIRSCNAIDFFNATLPWNAEAYWVHANGAVNITVEHQ